jgi:hypothetical protein
MNWAGSNATDLTTLAVRAASAQKTGATAQPRQVAAAPQPAVIIDPRTAALAADAAERDAPPARDTSGSDAETEARLSQGVENRRFMAEQAEAGVNAMRAQLSNSREMVRRFEETGQFWQADNNGVLQLSTVPESAWAVYGGVAGYVAQVKESLEPTEKAIARLTEGAAELRAQYLDSLK